MCKFDFSSTLHSTHLCVTSSNNLHFPSENYGNFTTDDILLFNVGDDAYTTFNFIMDSANSISESSTPEQCTNLLDQFHQSCDPQSSDTCSSGNDQSFQLSVDEVCNSIDNPTKLLFSAIGDKFDGYASDDGKARSKTDTTRFF